MTENDLRGDIAFIERQLSQLRVLRETEKARHGRETTRTRQMLSWIRELSDRKERLLLQLRQLKD